jgi:hypothetical protein
MVDPCFFVSETHNSSWACLVGSASLLVLLIRNRLGVRNLSDSFTPVQPLPTKAKWENFA